MAEKVQLRSTLAIRVAAPSPVATAARRASVLATRVARTSPITRRVALASIIDLQEA